MRPGSLRAAPCLRRWQPPNPTAEPPANVCPSSTELRDMENPRQLHQPQHRGPAVHDRRIRRARQCAKGQGRYTEADWRISREAQAAQSSNSGAYEARLRAEGMHSAADPEGTRIARQREQETAAQAQAARRARREQQRQRNLPGSPDTGPCTAPSSRPLGPTGSTPCAAPPSCGWWVSFLDLNHFGWIKTSTATRSGPGSASSS